MEPFRMQSIEGLPAIHGGIVKLAGAGLGIESFGLQVLDFPAGFEHYPTHDHSEDGQEEVYVVVEGSASFDVAGTQVETPAGTILWIAPESRRTCTPGPEGVRILAIGSVPGGGYRRPEGFQAAVAQ